MKEALTRFVLLVSLFAFTACGGLPFGDSSPPTLRGWTRAADAPLPRFEAQGAAVGERLYVFGGFYNEDLMNLQTTLQAHVYDAGHDTWTRLVDMPEAITHASSATDGEVIYLAGGFDGGYGSSTDRVWLYDTRGDSWTPGPPLPAGRGAGALVRLERQLHYFGGVIREGDRYVEDSGMHWILNLDGERTWREAASLPNPRNHLGGVALDGRVYAIGGQHKGEERTGNQASVHAYDPATDGWHEVAPLPRPRGHVHASTLVKDGRIVVIGGVEQGGREVRSVLEYNPATDRWRELAPLPAPRQAAVAEHVGERIVVATGYGAGPQITTWLSR